VSHHRIEEKTILNESEGMGDNKRRDHSEAKVEGRQAAGQVLAVDVSESRLQLVRKGAHAQGVQHIISTTAGDLRVLSTSGCVAVYAC
jgi:hypothetical protein